MYVVSIAGAIILTSTMACVLQKILTGCAVSVFDRISLAMENLVENTPLVAKEHFLIMSPFLRDFKNFIPTIGKRNFPKTNDNFPPKAIIRVFR